jgi:hypothetical protein
MADALKFAVQVVGELHQPRQVLVEPVHEGTVVAMVPKRVAAARTDDIADLVVDGNTRHKLARIIAASRRAWDSVRFAHYAAITGRRPARR